MKITVVGTGYVGLVAGACFAESGNNVICVDNNENKVKALLRGEIPIYEPGLSDIVLRNTKSGRLEFTTSLKEGVEKSDIIFISVPTPQDEDGSADLTHVLDVAKGIGTYMNGPKFIVDKSTVPVGTAKKVKDAITAVTSHRVEVISNPEFLKEGAAIDDFMKPDRVVVGVESEEAAQVMRELYEPFVRNNHPILVMDVVSAEMTKYAANTMLALRVSFMNEVANLCEASGANINQVRLGIGTDARIGQAFLFPGIGYGGSCFPKDVQAFIKTGRDFGLDMRLARACEEVNKAQKRTIRKKLIAHFGEEGIKGKKFALWGLAFKPKTDDVREAPALTVCEDILELGGTIVAFDPEAIETFRQKLGEKAGVSYTETDYDALVDADALIICTEWSEFSNPDFEKVKKLLKSPVIFDGRNVYSRKEMSKLGFTYYGVGRPAVR